MLGRQTLEQGGTRRQLVGPSGCESGGPASRDGDEQVVCPNCGAGFSALDARCPYCGTLNPVGAEAAYMDELEDLRQDTDRLAEDVQSDLAADLKRNARKIALIALAAIALIATMVLALNCADSRDERNEVKRYQEREAFREQHFAELDRLYESGDDAALVEYAWSVMDEPGYDAVYSWKHEDYLDICGDWVVLSSFSEDATHASAGIDDYAWAVSAAIRLACLDEDGRQLYAALSSEEAGRVAGYRESAESFLRETLQMDAEQVESFAASVEDSQGHVQHEKVKKAVAARFRQLGIT